MVKLYACWKFYQNFSFTSKNKAVATVPGAIYNNSSKTYTYTLIISHPFILTLLLTFIPVFAKFVFKYTNVGL